MHVSSVHAALGEALFQAFERGEPLDPPTATHPGFTVDDAYAAQRELVARHEAAGRRVVGRKIGLTSAAIQRQLGVSEPDFGVILDSHVFASADTIASDGMILPRIEAELAFRLGEDLPADADAESVLAATSEIVPVFEIIDSRVRDWKITLADTVADNASCWGVVASAGVPVSAAGALDAVTVRLLRDGALLEEGIGAAVMGNPAEAVAWLAGELGRRGTTLAAGELVLSGSFTAAVPAEPGRYEADFTATSGPSTGGSGLPAVEVTITR